MESKAPYVICLLLQVASVVSQRLHPTDVGHSEPVQVGSAAQLVPVDLHLGNRGRAEVRDVPGHFDIIDGHRVFHRDDNLDATVVSSSSSLLDRVMQHGHARHGPADGRAVTISDSVFPMTQSQVNRHDGIPVVQRHDSAHAGIPLPGDVHIDHDTALGVSVLHRGHAHAPAKGKTSVSKVGAHSSIFPSKHAHGGKDIVIPDVHHTDGPKVAKKAILKEKPAIVHADKAGSDYRRWCVRRPCVRGARKIASMDYPKRVVDPHRSSPHLTDSLVDTVADLAAIHGGHSGISSAIASRNKYPSRDPLLHASDVGVHQDLHHIVPDPHHTRKRVDAAHISHAHQPVIPHAHDIHSHQVADAPVVLGKASVPLKPIKSKVGKKCLKKCPPSKVQSPGGLLGAIAGIVPGAIGAPVGDRVIGPSRMIRIGSRPLVGPGLRGPPSGSHPAGLIGHLADLLTGGQGQDRGGPRDRGPGWGRRRGRGRWPGRGGGRRRGGRRRWRGRGRGRYDRRRDPRWRR